MIDSEKNSKTLSVLLGKQQNKIILFFIVVLISSVFYWYEIRPTFVRNSCVEDAIDYAENNTPDPDTAKLSDSFLEVNRERWSEEYEEHKRLRDVYKTEKRYLEAKYSTALFSEKYYLEGERNDVIESQYNNCMFSHGLEKTAGDISGIIKDLEE